MRRARSLFSLLLGGAVLLPGLADPAAVLAQSQPKFPTPLPAPKPAAAPAPAGAPAATPAPATGAEAPPAASQGPRDPFSPLVQKPEPGQARRAQEIEGLKLVGVIWDVANREQIRALVETPDGLGYYLRANEEKFGGKVVAIDRDRVQFSVREDAPGGQGQTRIVELKLPKPDIQ